MLQDNENLIMDIQNIKQEWNAALIDILKAFAAICARHGLTYYGSGGTAIGAVRHHGLIPWDDDIDVIMPRPDYDRLIAIAKTEDWGKYELITPYGDDTYPLYFLKISNRETTLVEDRRIPCVIGLYVDIFPLDGTADDVETAWRLKDRYTKIANRLNAISTHNTFGEYLALLANPKEWGRFAVKTLGFFCRAALRRRFLRQMDALSHRYDYDKAHNVQVYTGSYGHREVFPKAWLGQGKKFPFEDTEIPLAEAYDEYLRHFFSDYMQFPPEEQRIEKHHRAYLNIHRKERREEIRPKVDFKL